MRSVCRVDIVATWRAAKAQFAAVVAERDALRQELAEVKQTLRELQAAVLERSRAFNDLTVLVRERAIHRAQEAQRDPNAMLN